MFGFVAALVDSSDTFMNAIHLLHQHDETPFHERLIDAARMIFPDMVQAFQLWGKVDEANPETINIDFGSDEACFIEPSGLLIPVEHPCLKYVVGGGCSLMRLEDFVAERELPCTGPDQIAFWPIEVRPPVSSPLVAEVKLGALTLSRPGRRSFTSDDLRMAAQFARFIVQAHHVSAVLAKARSQRPGAEVMDRTPRQPAELSHREAEVLHWMCQGKRDKEIAIILGISYRTVTHHVSAILKKLGVEMRTAAVAAASQQTGLP